MKKIVSMMLCIAMLFAMSVTAFADNSVSDPTVCNDAATTSSMKGYISGTNVNFRKSPSTSSDSWGQFEDGEEITILTLYYEYADGYWWTKVSARGLTGYVASMYVHYY